MADTNRRKGGATAARSHQNYLQMTQHAPGTPKNQQQQFQAYQQNPYQYPFQQAPYKQQQQQQQQQQVKGYGATSSSNNSNSNNNQTNRFTRTNVRGQQQKAAASAKMGIKSGMTVEDLKRLTQKRMQQSPAMQPVTQAANLSQQETANSRPSTPKINIGVVNNSNSAAPVLPKTGMSVQELKQLTTLRLASQNVPMHQTEITGLVSKAVLSNAAKSHYRDSLRGSLTPSSTPKRTSSGGRFGSSTSTSNNAAHVPEVRGHRSRSRSSQLTSTVETAYDAMPARYSYSGGQTLEDFHSFDLGGNSPSSSQETDPYARPSLDFDDDRKYSYEEPQNSLQFPEDSFPPPPPFDENGGFVATSLPSWSPPPARAKKLDASATPISFYNHQTSYYNIASKEEVPNQDQNAVIAPPPGLSRRPSMTVPWQVAEAVLNTPQTTTGRKQIGSPTSSSKTSSEPETSNMFAYPSKTGNRVQEGSGALKSPAAEAAAQLGALSLQGTRQRSGTGGSVPLGPTGTSVGAGPSLNGARRGSFGNAAEFFKFRRRSKSRLELARDLSSNEGISSYGISAMPGIDERNADTQDHFSGMGHVETVSDASSSSSDDGESSSQDYTDEDVVRVTGGYDDPSEITGNFVSFYHATGAGRSRDNLSGLSSLSIPPPPPPMTDEEDNASTTSSKGLPMMSPNGVKLRKVAELARRGSLSSEDKTRAKDEIIQNSLGIGANNAARIFSSRMPAPAASNDRPLMSPSIVPPPGFQIMSSTPPRNTPKATVKKSLAPGAGIVRSAGGVPARSPPKKAMLSPSNTSRKGLATDGNADAAGSLEERLATAAQKVADCVSKGDMIGFQKAMDELDWLRNEANSMMRA